MSTDPFKSVFGSDRGRGDAHVSITPDFVVAELSPERLSYLQGDHLAHDIPCEWTPWISPTKEDIHSNWKRYRQHLYFSPQIGQRFLLDIEHLKESYASWPYEIERLDKIQAETGAQVVATVTEVDHTSEKVAFIGELGRFALVYHGLADPTIGVTIQGAAKDHFFNMGLDQLGVTGPQEATVFNIPWSKLPKPVKPGKALYALTKGQSAKLVLSQRLVDDCRSKEDVQYVADLQAALDSGKDELEAKELHVDDHSRVHWVRLADGTECFGVEGDAAVGCILDYPDGTTDAFYAQAQEFTLEMLDWVSEPASKIYGKLDSF